MEIILATVIAATLAAIALMVPRVAQAYPTGWTVQRQVVGNDAAVCDVAAYGAHVWVTWRTQSTGAIWVRHSSDQGATWAAEVCLDNGAFENGDPCVVVGSNTSQHVYVMFAGKRDGGGRYQLQFYRGSSWGAAWERTYLSVSASNKTQVDASRAAQSNTIFFAYTDDVSGVPEIYWGKVAVDGTVLVGTRRSTDDGISSNSPTVAANDYADAIIVWKDESGGGFNRSHLLECHTGDGGDNWTGQHVPDVDNESSYRLTCPTVAWDTNEIDLVCMVQNVNTGLYFVGRFACTTMGFNWIPVNIADSSMADTNAVACYPSVTGRFLDDIFYKNSTSKLSQLSGPDDILGTATVASAWHAISSTSNNFVSDAAVDYIAAVSSGGQLYVRRKDAVDPTANITTPAFSESDPVYFKADFAVECLGAFDDFAVDGTDIQTGIQYRAGIENVTYTCTTNGGTWNPLSCSGSTNISTTPPYNVNVNAATYNQGCIKIKAVAKDSAGNLSEYITPGWVYVDMNAPSSSLGVSGTKGDNGFYRSNAKVNINHSDFCFDHSEYLLENLDTGQKDKNWTKYTVPFTLTEGHWKVYYRSADRAGNVEGTRTGLVNVDRTPPVCSVIRPSKDTIQTGYYTDEAFRITGTGTDANDLSWAAIYVDGVKKYETRSAFNMAYTWKLAGVPEGAHTIMVQARDRAGNSGKTTKYVYVGNVAKDWYFAEGNTLPEFDEWLCVLNPGDEPARYQISFMLDNGEVRTFERSMNPKQRDTVKVKDYIGEPRAGVSVRIHSDSQGVIAERPMYFVYKNGVGGYSWKGGHNVMGINVLQKEWYFAEGTTRFNDSDTNCFEEWLTIQNPSDTQAASITVTYMLASGQNVQKAYTVAPHSRSTIEVAKDVGINQDVSTRLVSDVPIAVERPMYFNYHGFAVDGSNVVGATGPSDSWSFAEGCTRPGFQEWLTIQNPNGVPATCRIRYLTGAGKVTNVERTVRPNSRETVDVLANVGDNQDVSITMSSDVPVIAERPIYYIYGMDSGKNWCGGDSVVGNPSPSTSYFLAEGTTISNFDTFYTLMNPRDDESCNVTVEYIFGDGSAQRVQYLIRPHSRLTVNVRDAIAREANVSGSISADFPIVIERPMYFNYGQGITGGHDVNGYGLD